MKVELNKFKTVDRNFIQEGKIYYMSLKQMREKIYNKQIILKKKSAQWK